VLGESRGRASLDRCARRDLTAITRCFPFLFLDSRHRLIEYVELFRGTIDSAVVHPREVVKEALARNAAAVVLAHGHPLCFVRGVNLGLRRGFGLALFLVQEASSSCRFEEIQQC
jgi:hypothetical protein